MKKAIRIFDLILAGICAVIFVFVVIGNSVVPSEVTAFGNTSGSFSSIYTYGSKDKTSSVNYQSATAVSQEVRLLGVVPVKTISVSQSDTKTVFVSGEVFGIKLYTDGVIVVGTQSVDSDRGKVNPAEESGIQVGDIIVSINNTEVFSSNEVTAILNDNNGGDYTIKVKRDGRYRTFTLHPAYSQREGCYKAGMWVRDSTAGIGTITFYNKDEGTFAALGHQVNDVDTNMIMPLLEG
ncbi:MAG: PDZ domain-containing protein, partial [Ruminococcaceae bacterium]|nr:PDZ domain-containing protein [Oscillospiraceae bacterium]